MEEYTYHQAKNSFYLRHISSDLGDIHPKLRHFLRRKEEKVSFFDITLVLEIEIKTRYLVKSFRILRNRVSKNKTLFIVVVYSYGQKSSDDVFFKDFFDKKRFSQ